MAAQHAPLKLLVVEDDDISELLLSRLLTNAGYQVVVAKNGREALDIMQANRFRCAFMDIRLPVLDGLRHCKRITETGSNSGGHLQSRAVSAFATENSVQQCLEVGMDAFISKRLTATSYLTLYRLYFRGSRDHAERKSGIESATSGFHLTKEQLEAILNAVPAIFIRSRCTSVMYAYHTAHPELLYAPPEEFIGHKVTDVLPPPASTLIAAAIAETAKSGENKQVEYCLPTRLEPFGMN